MTTSELKLGSTTLIPKCLIARSFLSRFLGLMGRRAIGGDEALLFPSCNSIHTFFMRFPIDVVFVTKDGRVVEIVEALRPWRLLLPRRAACHVIELGAFRAKQVGISPGEKLHCQGVWA